MYVLILIHDERSIIKFDQKHENYIRVDQFCAFLNQGHLFTFCICRNHKTDKSISYTLVPWRTYIRTNFPCLEKLTRLTLEQESLFLGRNLLGPLYHITGRSGSHQMQRPGGEVTKTRVNGIKIHDINMVAKLPQKCRKF